MLYPPQAALNAFSKIMTQPEPYPLYIISAKSPKELAAHGPKTAGKLQFTEPLERLIAIDYSPTQR